MAIALVKETADLRLGTCGPLLVNVWFREATVPALDVLYAEQQTLIAQYGKVTFLSVAQNVPKAPGPDVAAWLKQKQLTGEQSRGTIIALTARGLSAVIARSFIAAVSLFSRDTYVVVKTLEEAAAAARKLPQQEAHLVNMASLAADLHAFVELPRQITAS
ncbi:MAG: hypothetical protein QM817_08275 [Archangium sp.]